MSEETLYDWMNRQKAADEVTASQSGFRFESSAARVRSVIWERLLSLVKPTAELTYLQRKFVSELVTDAASEGQIDREFRKSTLFIATYLNSAQ